MAVKKNQIYHCEACGNIVSVFEEGGGELVCCGAPMVLLEENTVDAAKEKHVPVIEKIDGGYKVKLGSVPHPMTDKHYITWIELFDGENFCIKRLSPGDEPEADFCACASTGGTVFARAYCNLHGLWKGTP